MAISVEREIRELQKAGDKLEHATKDWSEAFRRYRGALRALSRKALPKKRIR